MSHPAAPASPNLDFLARYDRTLVAVAVMAEQYFAQDPVTCLMKLRQFGELLAQQVAARAGMLGAADEPQTELLGRLRRDTAYPRDVIDLFHDLRRVGNDAVHNHRGEHATALAALKVARQLAVWFHRTFGDRTFRSGPFQPPRPPADPTAALQAELDRLRADRLASLSAADAARQVADAAEAARRTAEDRARTEAEERAVWESLAAEAEARLLATQEELARVQTASAAQPAAASQLLTSAAQAAAAAIDLDEQATRALIDSRLRARGWEADTTKSPTLVAPDPLPVATARSPSGRLAVVRPTMRSLSVSSASRLLFRSRPHSAWRPGKGCVHDDTHRQRANLRRHLRPQGARRHHPGPGYQGPHLHHPGARQTRAVRRHARGRAPCRSV